ncbi:MAG: sugar ABC transporter permease [Tenericutes bacterium]|nr:sugar ABC transporter permease [Mycoplasmatota bacterium]
MNNEDNADKKGFLSAFHKFFNKIKELFVAFAKRFKDASTGTKISHFVMGFGNIKHKQILKGIIFFIVQLGFISLMVFSPEINATPFGSKSLVNLITLGTEAGDISNPTDNSMLMLLFGIVTIGMILLFVMTYFASIRSSYKADLDIREGKLPTTFKQDLQALLDERFHIAMLTPALIGILVFTLLPTIFMISIAFTNFDSLHPAGQVLFDWVGFENFVNVFNGTGEIGHRFLPVLGWTILWAFLATFSNYIGGILLALLINRKGVKGKKVWRTIFIVTIALPQFITLLAMRNLMADYGPINTFMVNIGLIDEPINFLANAASPWVARITIVVINIWIGVPFTMLMTSGILMNVPRDLYEAAQIDGATKRQAFRYITIPYVVFVTTPYLITSFIGNITNFNIIFLLTGGAPNVPGYIAGETDLLITWLYKLTIDQNEYNLGAVVGILTFIITATATLLTYTRSKSFKEEDAFQ